MPPYRVNDPPEHEELDLSADWEGMQPPCPACGYKFTNNIDSYGREYKNKYNDCGNICHGKRSFWSDKQLCPNRPHYHPVCKGCKYTWVMKTRMG